jgi:hypothetical protein
MAAGRLFSYRYQNEEDNLMPVFTIAQYQVNSHAVDKVKKAIEEFVNYVKVNEPKTRMFHLFSGIGRRTCDLYRLHLGGAEQPINRHAREVKTLPLKQSKRKAAKKMVFLPSDVSPRCRAAYMGDRR